MSKFPVIQQQDSMDCGPVCLAMICKFYGKYYPVSFLHNLCFITTEGVSLYGIALAAESVGFRSFGTMLTIQELAEKMRLPCIIYWNKNHFVVLYEITSKKTGYEYYIANPAGGVRLKFSEAEFANSFLCTTNENGLPVGVALYLEPSQQFYENNESISEKGIFKRNTMNFLYRYVAPYKKHLCLLFGVVALGTFSQFVLPILSKAIVDEGIANKEMKIIFLILLGQMFLEVGCTTLNFMRNWILLKASTQINISLISDYLSKLMRLPMSFFETKLTGDITQRINDHTRIQSFLTNSSLDTIFSIISLIVFGIIILTYNWVVALIFWGGSVLYLLWVKMFMRRREMLDHKMFAMNSANQSSIIQLIEGMQEIKLNACEQTKHWEWERIQRNLYRLSLKGLKLAQYQQLGGTFINQMKNLSITSMVAMFVIRGNVTLGMMLSIQYIIGMMNSPVEQLVNFARQLQDAKLSLNRLCDVYLDDDEDQKNLVDFSDRMRGDIILKNVKFSYDKLSDIPTINDVSFQIPEGKVTAIVGLSGSGKTTLLKLILGFYNLDGGSIMVGNEQLADLNKRNWRKKCGVVMQDGFIFSDTIARNIALDTMKLDIERVKRAAKIANIQNYIESLPLQYNTKIGRDGHGLSLGQKQRILIAREVYKNPDYVFLDEATNSLDANNESEIMNHLNTFIKGKTAIVIAHRLSTVKDADNIIVLKNGRIVEQGKHVSLISQKGIYYELVKNQLEI